jgi:hypothetical protein
MSPCLLGLVALEGGGRRRTGDGEHLGEIGDGVAVNAWRPPLNCAVAH